MPFESALGVLAWISFLVIPFTLVLFGVGLRHFLQLIHKEADDPERSEKVVTFTWGLLIMAMLLGQLMN